MLPLLCRGPSSTLLVSLVCLVGVCSFSFCQWSGLVTSYLAINVALAFCMGTDLDSILNNPIGQPMATIFFNSFGQKGTLAVWAIVVIVQ